MSTPVFVLTLLMQICYPVLVKTPGKLLSYFRPDPVIIRSKKTGKPQQEISKYSMYAIYTAYVILHYIFVTYSVYIA